MIEPITNQKPQRWGSYEDAEIWAQEAFLRKTAVQRLEWLEEAQELLRAGRNKFRGHDLASTTGLAGDGE